MVDLSAPPLYPVLMARNTRFLVLAALGASISIACSEGRSATAATREDTAQAADDPVLAEVRGEAIRQSEIDEEISSELQGIEQQLYDLRSDPFDLTDLAALKPQMVARFERILTERISVSFSATT